MFIEQLWIGNSRKLGLAFVSYLDEGVGT